MTAYNGSTITYDAIGNPLRYRNNMQFAWSNGRQLVGVYNPTYYGTTTYTYNADGLRASKTVNNLTTQYYWLDGVMLGETYGSNQIIYLYDENGIPYGFINNDAYYYYVQNAQGDIIGILDADGNTIVEYTYSAWGEILSITGSLASTIGKRNPLRYRGYYYDTETGFYYLQSRYYDPITCRFINADSLLNQESILGYNMFAYCLDNPINKIDCFGNKPGDLFDTMDEAAIDFAMYINQKSILENREYSSYIYSVLKVDVKFVAVTKKHKFLFWNWNTTYYVPKIIVKLKYGYVEPQKGTIEETSIPSKKSIFHNKSAEIHTHAAYDPYYMDGNDLFSPDDLNNFINYLVTPLGTIRKYNPKDGSDIVIYWDAPFDQNHPAKKGS